MNSRQRVLTAINHREPDRVPFDFGAASTSGIIRDAYQQLADHLNYGREDIELIDKKYQTVQLDYSFSQLAGSDAFGLYPSYTDDWQISVEENEQGGTFLIDEWGIRYKKMKDGSFINYRGPLEDTWLDDGIETLKWPEPVDPRRLTRVHERLEGLPEDEGTTKVMNFFTQGLFELSTWLVGYEEFLTGLIRQPEKACSLLDRLVEIKKVFWGWALDELGGSIDVIKQNDDLGEKQKPLISPDLYRKYLKPRHKELHRFIKKHAEGDVYILFHSDGSILDLIEDFIETGVDILNPIQLSANKMDPKVLKKRFGDSVVFWGGGIDVSTELPAKTPSEIKDIIKRRLDIFAPDGGFVFAPTQSIQSDVPPENVVATWEAVKEYGKY